MYVSWKVNKMESTPEKEILYQIDIVQPESFYTKPLLGKKAKIRFFAIQLLICIIIIESIIMVFLDRTLSRLIWMTVPVVCIIHAVKTLFIKRKKRKEAYEKVLAENENHYSYTFYTDYVNVKTPSLEDNFKYSTAEGYVENEETMTIIFSLNRGFTLDKKQCSQELIDFIKGLVPIEKQKKINKKSKLKHIIAVSVIALVAILHGCTIVGLSYIRNNTYYLKSPGSTYESFLACLEHGTVDDVLIIKDRYVEYTYTGREEDKRYYTICSEDINELIEYLNYYDVTWKKSNAKYCKTE